MFGFSRRLVLLALLFLCNCASWRHYGMQPADVADLVGPDGVTSGKQFAPSYQRLSKLFQDRHGVGIVEAKRTPRVLSQFLQSLLSERYDWHESARVDAAGVPIDLHVPVHGAASASGAGDEEDAEQTRKRKRVAKDFNFQESIEDRAKAWGVSVASFVRWAIGGAKSGTANAKATLTARFMGHLGESDSAKRMRLDDPGQTEQAMVDFKFSKDLPSFARGYGGADFHESGDALRHAAFDVAHAVGGCASDSDMSADVDPLKHAQKVEHDERKRKQRIGKWTTRAEILYAKLLRLRTQIKNRYFLIRRRFPPRAMIHLQARHAGEDSSGLGGGDQCIVEQFGPAAASRSPVDSPLPPPALLEDQEDDLLADEYIPHELSSSSKSKAKAGAPPPGGSSSSSRGGEQGTGTAATGFGGGGAAGSRVGSGAGSSSSRARQGAAKSDSSSSGARSNSSAAFASATVAGAPDSGQEHGAAGGDGESGWEKRAKDGEEFHKEYLHRLPAAIRGDPGQQSDRLPLVVVRVAPDATTDRWLKMLNTETTIARALDPEVYAEKCV
eukprot:g20310.t1